MITGINTIFEHDGRKLHLQAEDLGDEATAFEVRVYDEGSVVWQKRRGTRWPRVWHPPGGG